MSTRVCKVCNSMVGKGLPEVEVTCSPLCVNVYDEWRKMCHTDGRTLFQLYMERKHAQN